jgi:hypothetical protein
VDNLQVAADTAKSWLLSDDGMTAQQAQPAGYENVKAYLKACTQLLKAQQFQQAMAMQAMQGQGPAADLTGADAMTAPDHLKPADKNPPKSSPPSGGEASQSGN